MVEVSRALYPFDSQFHQLDSGRLHYLDEGDGRPLVMVHGNPSWSFYYRNVVTAMRDDARCIVPDHLGCGLSDKPSDADYDYTLANRISDLGSLLDEAVPDGQLDMIVHDWGGAIGFGWAVQNPERIRRLVVLNTGAFRNPAGQKIPPTLALIRNTPLGKLLVQGFNAFSAGATRMAVVKPMAKAVRAAYVAPYNTWSNRVATLKFVKDIPLSAEDAAWTPLVDTEEALERLRDKPMLICWGEKDFVFDDNFLTEWKTRFPKADVHTYPDAGHYVLEDAGDSIIPKIQSFLSGP